MSKLWPLRRKNDDERGAILIMATVGMVLAVISAALAVDTGRIAQEKRNDQKVADMAALDAARDIVNADARAQQSAFRNNFPWNSAGHSLTTEVGSVTAGVFQPGLGATAVRVTVTSPVENVFQPGGRTVTARAVAQVEPRAQISVGSKLASINTDTAILLNPIMSGFFNTSVNSSFVGYQGLTSSSVSLAELVAADNTLGSPEQLLSGETNLRRLAQATLTVMNTKAASGNTAALNAATALAQFASTVDSTLKVKLGDILAVDSPSAADAANAQINVFDLLTTSGQGAQLLNGNNFLVVPVNLTIPGLVSSTLRLTLIEPAKLSALGPARMSGTQWVTRAETAQMAVRLDTHIVVPPSPLGCLVLCVDLQLPIEIGGAEAVASLTDIDCASPVSASQVDVLVETASATAEADAVLAVKVANVSLPLPPVVNVSKAVGGGSETRTFTGPFPTAIQSTAATGAGLSQALTGSFTVLGGNLGPVLSLLDPVTTAIDDKILGPLFDALGLAVGGADTRAMQVDCTGSPNLVG